MKISCLYSPVPTPTPYSYFQGRSISVTLAEKDRVDWVVEKVKQLS